MNGQEQAVEARRTAEVVMGGSLAEAVIGGGAVILAIVGLAGGMPMLLVGIATIAVGAALMFKGASLATRFSDILNETSEGRLDMAELGAGTTTESVGGAAGITLGILAVLNVVPLMLVSVAVILFGGTVILGAGADARLNHLRVYHSEKNPLAQMVAREAVSSATVVQLMIGLSAVVLGILALLNIQSMTLVFVALLGISAAVLLSGSALSGRMLTTFRV